MAVLRDIYGLVMGNRFPRISGIRFHSNLVPSIYIFGTDGTLKLDFSEVQTCFFNNSYTASSHIQYLDLSKRRVESPILLNEELSDRKEELSVMRNTLYHNIKGLKPSLDVLIKSNTFSPGEIDIFNLKMNQKKKKIEFSFGIEDRSGNNIVGVFEGIDSSINSVRNYLMPPITFFPGINFDSTKKNSIHYGNMIIFRDEKEMGSRLISQEDGTTLEELNFINDFYKKLTSLYQ